MSRYRWPLLLAILYIILVASILFDDPVLTLRGIGMLLVATGILGWAVWLWAEDEDVADQQYVESVMRSDRRDCLVCSGKAEVSDLDRFNVLGLCRPHLRQWAELHGVWKED